ncbi:MAG: metallophosphoesterase family protein [Marinilabiliaceae bacterium]
MNTKIRLASLLMVLVLTGACEDIIEYSPYQAGTGSEKEKSNNKAIDELSGQSKDDFEPFTIAIIGDSHTYYDDFEDQIEVLNQIDSIDFVVHNGDITLSGIYREFVWFKDIVDALRYPLITIIGNHDFLSNGKVVFQDMFGPLNFTLDYNNCRFVFFDDIIWEKNVEDPDFEWLYNACNTENKATHTFVFAHIPPWNKSFSMGNRYLYYYIIDEKNVSISIHGHTHSFFHGKKENSEVPFLITGDSRDREIVLLNVRADTLIINRENF